MSHHQQVLGQDARHASSLHGKLIIAAVFLSAIGALYVFDLMAYVSLDVFNVTRQRLLAFTEDYTPSAVALFILLYILQTGFSLAGATLMTVTAGLLIGSLWAALYVTIGATTGATPSFLGARYLRRDWVEQRFGDRLHAVQAGFAQNAFNYLPTLRLIPRSGFLQGAWSTHLPAGNSPGSIHWLNWRRLGCSLRSRGWDCSF